MLLLQATQDSSTRTYSDSGASSATYTQILTFYLFAKTTIQHPFSELTTVLGFGASKRNLVCCDLDSVRFDI